jgi:hypothetical protein
MCRPAGLGDFFATSPAFPAPQGGVNTAAPALVRRKSGIVVFFLSGILQTQIRLLESCSGNFQLRNPGLTKAKAVRLIRIGKPIVVSKRLRKVYAVVGRHSLCIAAIQE